MARSKGEGTIYISTTNQKWVAQITLPNGKRKTKYGKSQREVKEWLLSARKASQDGVYVEKDNLTLSVFIGRYLEDVAKHTLRPKTIQSYEYILRLHILPELGKIKLTALRPDHLQALYSLKLEKGLSARTVHYIHAILHKVLNQALKWGLVVRNVADLVDPPRVPKDEPVILTVEQAKKLLLTTTGTRYFYIYLLAITGGLREGEILGLLVSDLDLNLGVVHITKAVQFLPGKGLVITEPKTKNAIRAVKLPAFTIPLLQEYIDSLKGNQKFLFETSNGTPIAPRNLLRHFHQRLELMGIPKLPFHSLRHLNASILLLAGAHPKSVQGRLGHSTVLLTLDRYSHLLPGVDDDAAERIDGVFTS